MEMSGQLHAPIASPPGKEQLYKMCGVFFEGVRGWVGGGRDLIVSIVGTMT